MSLLRRRVAFVTGGSGGLGRAIATQLAREGAIVTVGFFRHEGMAQKVVDEIRREGGAAFGTQCDVTNIDQLAYAFKVAYDRESRLDILINGAGALLRPSAWREIDESTFQRTLDINLKGAFNCTRVALPLLEGSSSHASIVNVSSTTGPFLSAPGAVAYAAAKAGVNSLTRTFAKALAPKIRVNAVCPGYIDAGITKTSAEDFLRAQISKTPLGRLGAASEVANAVVFLASDYSSYITGHMLVVDGGHSVA